MHTPETHVARPVVEAFHEPGNATRYHLMLIAPAPGDACRTFVWVNAPGGGRAVRLNVDGCVHLGYLAEKLRHDNEADLKPIMRWLAMHGVDCYLD